MNAPLGKIEPWHTGPGWSGWIKPEAAGPAITAMNALDDIADIAWRDTGDRDRDIVGDGDLIRISLVLRAARDDMVSRFAAGRRDIGVSPPLEALDHITGILASADGAFSRMTRIREVLRGTGRGMSPAGPDGGGEEEIHLDQSRIGLLKAAGWRVAGWRAGSYVRLSPAGSVRESVLIPLDPSAPEYGEAMRAAVAHIRQIVACGTASAAALLPAGDR